MSNKSVHFAIGTHLEIVGEKDGDLTPSQKQQHALLFLHLYSQPRKIEKKNNLKQQ